jgi:hypothetical protein
MFYCLIASYHYVIEHCYVLSNLKRTAVTLYVVSSPDKLTTMRMLHRKVQPLKHTDVHPRWHIETVKFLGSSRLMIVNTYLHVYYNFIEPIVKTVDPCYVIHARP